MKDSELKKLKDEGYEFIELKRAKRNNGSTEKRIVIKHLLCGNVYECRHSKFFGEGQRCTCLRKRENAIVSDTNSYQNMLNEKYR